MSEKTKVTQNAGLGANDNTFIAEQNNYGLSVKDATEMAFAIFRQYYPELRDEALTMLKDMLNEKLSGIPLEQITSPTPRVAVPTLLNASITEEVEIRKMYAELLANSMNSIAKNGVHPGFVEIIKQLSPDEAKILQYIKNTNFNLVPTITLRYETVDGDGIEYIKNFSDIGEIAHCDSPLKINMYFDNLTRLGILVPSNHASMSDKKKYEPLKNNKYILGSMENPVLIMMKYNKTRLVEGYVGITDYGKQFCKICMD